MTDNRFIDHNANAKAKWEKIQAILDVQRESGEWRQGAYPETATIELQALGVAEEAGELCHAVLKYKQGIRGYDLRKTQDEVADAIGDIFIYACGVADTLGINVVDSIVMAWHHVRERNITQGSNPGTKIKFPTIGPADEYPDIGGAGVPFWNPRVAECGQPWPCGHAPDGGRHPVVSE